MILKLIIAVPLAIYTLMVLIHFCLPNKYVTYTYQGSDTGIPVSEHVFWAIKGKQFFILWACVIAFAVLWYVPL